MASPEKTCRPHSDRLPHSSRFAVDRGANCDFCAVLRQNIRNSPADSPAVRFLLGCHYGYLGYPRHSVREFDKVLNRVPQDELTQKLRIPMSRRLSAVPPTTNVD